MIVGERVVLRAYKEGDLKRACDFINDYEVKKLISIGTPFPYTEWEEEKWIKSNEGNKDMTYNFAIEDKENGKLIGGCGINETDLKNRNCMVGILIGDREYWSKGYGTEVLKLLVEFIFNEMNMHKVKLGVFSFNKRAIECYKKVGFKEEGRLKEEIFREGKYHDGLIMSIMASDYFNK